jgi:8-oxo-dGTP diphosphatase
MNPEATDTEFIQSYDPNKYARPCIAADAVVFRCRAGRLEVLLMQRRNPPFRGHWAFPGGFIEVYEDPDEAVRRELREETGVEVEAMFHLGVFGRPDRDPRYHVISTAYIGVAREDGPPLQADDDAMNAAWYPVKKTPPLAFDHEEVLDAALRRLREKMVRPSFALRFFERRFTGADLLGLYEAILGKRLDGARFLRRLGRLCVEKPAMNRAVRIRRAELRRFEATLGRWWV